MSTTSSRIAKLDRIQTFKVMQWIEGRKDYVRDNNAGMLARQMTDALGFQVAESTVSNLRREMGIQPAPGLQSGGSRLQYRAAIRVLAREVVDLRRKLNEPVSAELQALCNID